MYKTLIRIDDLLSKTLSLGKGPRKTSNTHSIHATLVSSTLLPMNSELVRAEVATKFFPYATRWFWVQMPKPPPPDWLIGIHVRIPQQLFKDEWISMNHGDG